MLHYVSERDDVPRYIFFNLFSPLNAAVL
jgi:hypothetical protein